MDRLKIENFIPITYKLVDSKNPHRELVPAINNLIFVYSSQKRISYLKSKNEVFEPLQYLMEHNTDETHTIIIVFDRQMEDFIRMASKTDDSVMYLDDESVVGKEGKHVEIGRRFRGRERSDTSREALHEGGYRA